jgi:hypothetical protein
VLRTNLATRPFYNDRAVRIGLALVGVIAIGLTTFNVVQVLRLRSQGADQRTVASDNETEARNLKEKARVIRQSIDRAALDAVQVSAKEANDLIDRRAFSWTDLFNRFESTLPADVRITAVQPQVDNEGRLLVAVTVVSKKAEDLDDFIDALEKTGAFSGMLPRQETSEDGITRVTQLQGFYNPPAQAEAPSTVPPSPSSEPEKKDAPGNKTPSVVAGNGSAGR